MVPIMSDPKFVIKAGEGTSTLLLGKSFVELQGKRQHCFETDNIFDFIRYLKEEDFKHPPFKLYGNIENVTAQSVNSEYKEGDIALFEIKKHPALILLLYNTDSRKDIEEFEELLKKLKQYTDAQGFEVFKTLRNIDITKILRVQKSSDNKGNCAYAFSRSGGSDDIEWPKTISFTVPVFRSIPEALKIKITFELIFKYSAKDDNVKLYFTLYNNEVFMEVEAAINSFISKNFEAVGLSLFSGTLHCNDMTDSWKYKESSVLL